MSKLFLILSLSFACILPATAQKFGNKLQPGLRKGGWQTAAGGNYYLLTQTTHNTPYGSVSGAINYYGENISGGYFIGRNIMLGASLHHGWKSAPGGLTYANLGILTQISAAPLVRAYLPFDEQFSLYAEAQYGYITDSYSLYLTGNVNPNPPNPYLTAQRTTSGTGGYFGGGMLILFQKHLGLDVNINYYTNNIKGAFTYTPPTIYQDTNVSLQNSGVVFHLGLQYFIFSDRYQRD